MNNELEKFNVVNLTKEISEDWKNFVVSNINDRVDRLSVLKRDFK
jgi:hypothetical protein